MKLLHSILFLFFITFNHEALSIAIVQSTPPPNYELTQSNTDLQELTDRLVYRHPAWTNKGSVGWTFSSPIQLEVALGTANNLQCNSGVLKIISAKKENAQVKLPRRIDIYGDNIHLQELSINNADYADDSAHTLAVELNQVPSQIKLIFHADGPYMMIDEIAWEPKQVCPDVTSRNFEQGKIADPLNDSKQRLLSQLLAKAKPTVSQQQPLAVWFDDPWGDLPTVRPSLIPNVESNSREVVGNFGTKQFLVLGVSGACEPGQNYQIRTTSPLTVVDKVNIFQIKEQLAFDGRLVYDPLLPINGVLPCPNSSSNAFLWIEMVLKAQADTLTEMITIEIKAATGDIRTAYVNINANNLGKLESCKLNAVNWAYGVDQPIWTVTSQAYSDLHAHGINVFVVPPWSMSLPNFDRKPVKIDASRLWKEISPALAKNRNAKFLLFMALDKWLETNKKQTQAEQEKQLINWVKAIDQYFKLTRLPRDQWMLYPIDEPIGTKVAKLDWVAKVIKATNPAIQIYANPIAAYKDSVTAEQLKGLQNKIDLFQPSVRLAQEQLPFFQNLKKPWWIYENPQSPAKTTTPAFYRALGIKAWSLGSSGVGFWSYSDTGLSSAWDDFDGKQPDWAVVYEDPKTITSSRRWEAFTKGLDDYRTLCQLEKNNSNTVFELKQQINSNLNNPGLISGILDKFILNIGH